MDKKDKKYIPPRAENNSIRSGYGRKVTPRNEYDIDRAQDELREKRVAQKRKQAEAKRRRRRRMRTMRIRALFALGAAVIIVIILLFFTPLLNVRGFNISGNKIVSTEEILTRLESLKGTNLIGLSEKDARKALSDISYIEEVSVAKFLIPPSASITVKECVPAARLEINGFNVIIDPQLKVLSDGEEFDAETLAKVSGLSAPKYTIGKTLETAQGDAEKTEVLETCLSVMDSLGILDKIDYIDLSDITNIRFGYEDRMEALCGTRLEIERKIRTFNAAVNEGSLESNARGTMDLSVLGRAEYNP